MTPALNHVIMFILWACTLQVRVAIVGVCEKRMNLNESFYGSGTKPKLAVACGAVRRVHSQPVYRSKDYEVCLTREGYSEQYRLLSRRVCNDEQPSAAALEHFKDHTQLKGGATYPLMVQGKPTSNTEHSITVLFVMPVGNEEVTSHPSVDTAFHSLADILENHDGQYDMPYGHREMIQSIAQWLKERHMLPFRDPDMLFACSSDGEATGGVVKAVLENPVYEAKMRPPEDNLVISFNNPLFTPNSPI